MPDDGDLYVLSSGDVGDEQWVSPRPVAEVVTELLVEETGVSADDVDELETYVDRETLVAHVDADSPDEPLTFDVEGHGVRLTTDGRVELDDG